MQNFNILNYLFSDSLIFDKNVEIQLHACDIFSHTRKKWNKSIGCEIIC